MIDCVDQHVAGNEAYLRRLNAEVIRRRVPYHGVLALTHRCNLRCCHCYTRPAAGRAARPEWTAASWLKLLDELRESGTMFLLLTGGEPLLRPDFAEIYRHACESGMLVTVFTNGVEASDSVLDLFVEYPPYAVEITVHGVTAVTFERIAGVAGSFRRCMATVARLRKRGIPLKIKTMLMTLNRHEMEAIARMAADWDVPFRFDACLFPTLDGDPAPLQWRVSAEDAVALEMREAQRVADWRAQFRAQPAVPVADRLFSCGAGVTSFHVDPWGDLQACQMIRGIRVSLDGSPFAEAWRRVVGEVASRREPPDPDCDSCGLKFLCGYCPGFFEMETGSERRRSEYLCGIGHSRHRIIEECAVGGGV